VNVKDLLELSEREADPKVRVFDRLLVSGPVRDLVGENLVRVNGGVKVRSNVRVRVGVLPVLLMLASSDSERLGVAVRPETDIEKLVDSDCVNVHSSEKVAESVRGKVLVGVTIGEAVRLSEVESDTEKESVLLNSSVWESEIDPNV
jgi:hypothetical protein